MVISDDGVSTMFDRDERGNSGRDVAAMALASAGGGGSLVLNLREDWEPAAADSPVHAAILSARDEQGWAVHRVSSWEELMAFARAFSRRQYGEEEAGPARW